ncbi:MAG: Type III pantothenate kinase [Firmicutes bacterium ADurb.Bin182]|nr:MAG: Type III pantothenate kinase [Firmicutes bacterium ADurb.Bin182]
MLLALDIGNTNIKVGLFRSGVLISSWRFMSDKFLTADEYGIKMESFFNHLKIPTNAVSGIVISSVIPSMNYTIEHMCNIYFHGRIPMMVSNELDLGIKNRYDHPETLGADRICNAVAAHKLYGGPCVAVDFGTATNFAVVSESGDFLGGLICPGFRVSADALIESAAMLPKVQFIKPDKVICTNTEQAVQAGIVYGYVGQVEYIIRKIRSELGKKPKVVATGGMASFIASESSSIDIVNPTLTLEGLSFIYEMNKSN